MIYLTVNNSMHVPIRSPQSFCPTQLIQPIGEGRRRKTYLHPSDPRSVIKVAKGGSGLDANVREWYIWFGAARNIKPLLAPCLLMWDRGRYLAQPRLADLDKNAQQQVRRIIDSAPIELQPKISKMHIWGWDQQELRPRIFDYEHLTLQDLDLDWHLK